MTSGEAIVTEILAIEKHPQADRLMVATVLGEQVIVGLDTKVGDRVIYFSCDLQLSEEFCEANDLVARFDENNVRVNKGYFDKNRRVRPQSFRGIKSQGFVCPLSYISYIDGAQELLQGQRIGFSFSKLYDHEICKKYIVLQKHGNHQFGNQKIKRKASVPTFLEHFDTDNLRYHLRDKVSYGDRIYITAKAHGTSQRFHCGIDHSPFPYQWMNRIYNQYMKPIYKHWVGSRRVIKGTIEPPTMLQNMPNLGRKWPYIQFKFQSNDNTKGYYGNEDFRFKDVVHLKLHKGETLYGEHVGWINETTPIMPGVPLKKLPKEIQKQYKGYGESDLYFTYGCKIGERRLLVYRITWSNEDGVVYELPWSQVKRRCEELGVEHVYEFIMYYVSYASHGKTLQEVIPDFSEFVERPDPLDPSHYMEGICIRIERENGSMDIYKTKSHTFLVGEGLEKDAEVVNIEDIESSRE